VPEEDLHGPKPLDGAIDQIGEGLAGVGTIKNMAEQPHPEAGDRLMIELALVMARREVLDVGAHRHGCLCKGHPRQIAQGHRHMRVMVELARRQRPGFKVAHQLCDLLAGAIGCWLGSGHRLGSFPLRRRCICIARRRLCDQKVLQPAGHAVGIRLLVLLREGADAVVPG
jgi:hypothetical protein